MKTDIVGSTPKFRALLSADLQAFLADHRTFVARQAADQGGQIVKRSGDGFWLTFPSVTAAARSAIAMQETLSFDHPGQGDHRVSMRIVIGVGDVGTEDGDLAGDVLALITRIEDFVPANEIYLTSAARSTLAAAEVQTSLVDEFVLQSYRDPVPVYRVRQRHRTRTRPDLRILLSDLRDFGRLTDTAPVVTIENVLDALQAVSQSVSSEFGGTVRYAFGDVFCLSFGESVPAIRAAVRFAEEWDAVRTRHGFGCPISLALHRGEIKSYRSFVYGRTIRIANRALEVSVTSAAPDRSDVVVSGAIYADLADTEWRTRFEPISFGQLSAFQDPPNELVDEALFRLSGLSTGARTDNV